MVITLSACVVKNWFLHLRFRLDTATPHRTVQTDHLVTSRFNFGFCGGFQLRSSSFYTSFASQLLLFKFFPSARVSFVLFITIDLPSHFRKFSSFPHFHRSIFLPFLFFQLRTYHFIVRVYFRSSYHLSVVFFNSDPIFSPTKERCRL